MMETKVKVKYKKHFPSLREYRSDRDLSQLELSQLIGVVRHTISDWERGLFFPNDENLIKLAQVFQVDLKTLRKNLMFNFKIKQLKKTIRKLETDFGLTRDEVLTLIT